MPKKAELASTHRVILKDIALRTGFSINTVSRSLNDKEDISEATKRLIKDVASQMGYISNAIAGALRSGMTKSIAIILGDISNPHFSILVKEIDMAVRKYGYHTFITNTDENSALELEAIQAALGKNVDGIIIGPTQKNMDNINYLKGTGIPFVLIGRYFHNLETDYVVCDDVHGGYLATRHLLKKGHRRILMLNGPSYISCARERLAGYQKALAESGIPFDPGLLHEVSITTGNRKNFLHLFSNGNTDFTAIFAYSDMVAWETIDTLNKIGRTVPLDIAIVGYDNIQAELSFPVPLTTIGSVKGAMSHCAVEILMNLIQNKMQTEYTHTVLQTKLVIREST